LKLWRVAVEGEETSAVLEPAAESSRALFVFAHGAGGHMADAGMLRLASALLARGLDIVRFNFLYREKGSRQPDRMPRLKACLEAVVSRSRAELAPRKLIIGGCSMGGRVASILAAARFACDGLLLFAYPLQPPDKPERLRDAHLPQIKLPVLCFNGTRDALCRRELMERAIDKHPHWEMHWLEGADHSFHVLKSSGRTDAEVLNEVGDAAEAWLARSFA